MKKIVVLNFGRYSLSDTALKQLGDPNVLHIPLSVTPDMDLTEYVDGILDKINIAVETDVIYMVVLPGLNILAGMVCRNLAERRIPYQIVNLIRSPEENEFVVQDVY